jgi:hypothetical protein
MKNKFIIVTISCIAIFTAYSCLDPYNPSGLTDNVNLLVADGYLNSSNGSCTLKLSRTVSVSTDTEVPKETGALVQLQDDDGNLYTLSEAAAGTYVADDLVLPQNSKYRLKIVTKNNIEYRSDDVSVIETPEIDSVSWKREDTGVSVFVTTHDPENKTHYYYWRYTETWQYRSAFSSPIFVIDGEIIPRYDNIYDCWKTVNSSNIQISSSKQLEQDLISEFKLTSIPWASPKLQLKYSIMVEQLALSQDAFEYWQELKKNTENLGTLFDPLPSTVVGNIKCITKPNEPVLGYFSASSVKMKRLFIANKDTQRPRGSAAVTGYEGCSSDTIPLNGAFNGQMPVGVVYVGTTPVGFAISNPSCVDCRILGGKSIKPDYWE